MEKILYPNHPVRYIITGHSEGGKSVFLSKLFLNSNNKYDKKYTSTHLVCIRIHIKN